MERTPLKYWWGCVLLIEVQNGTVTVENNVADLQIRAELHMLQFHFRYASSDLKSGTELLSVLQCRSQEPNNGSD